MKITRFFFESEYGNTDTYINGLVSWERAVNLARSIQSCSASNLVRIWHSTNAAVNGTLDPASDRRRLFTFSDVPIDEPVNLSSYKVSSDGFGLFYYLRLSIKDTTGHNHSLTIPNPLRILNEKTAQAEIMLDEARKAYLQGIDIKQAYSRNSGKWQFMQPNWKRKMFDEYRKEHPGEI